MVAPWIKKKRAAKAARKTMKAAAAKKTPAPKAAPKAAAAPKAPPAPTPVVEEVPVVETPPEVVEEAPALDLTSMRKWELVSHAQSLGHDVAGLTKSEILELLAQD